MTNPISTLLRLKDSKVHSITSESTVLEAVHEMNRVHIGSIVVVDDEKLVGIFTERDVLQRVVAVSKSPETTKVADVMSSEVETITPKTTVDETMLIMTKRRHRHLPVMKDDKLVGLVSIGDITRWISRANEDEAQNLRSYITGGGYQ